MRRYTIQLLLVSLSWFWLTTSCTHREARFRIGVSQCSDDEWRHQMNNEMLREALFYDGVEIDIRTVKDDNAEQIKDIRNFIKEGVDLLVVAPNEAAPITPVVEEAFDRGIPVIVFDRKILSDKYTAYIGADNYELGKAIGNYVANMLHGQGNVVEIAGLTGSTPAMDRHQGFVAAISPYPGIQLLAREDAGWLRSEAGEKMDTLLARFPEIDVVYAQNDRMAAGAYDVAERQGRAEEMRFIGTDALPGEGYGVEQVLNGQLDATFIYPTGGDRVIQMAMDILNKRDFPRETILSTSVVDATNAQIMQMQTSHIATLDEKIETMNGKMSQFLDRYATQQVILYGSLLVLLLVIGLLVAVYLSLRTKNRLNRELSRQKEKLEEQKQQLTQQQDLLIQQKEQLEQLSRELEEATHAKLVFFTNVSHDFRTPLTLVADPVEHLLADKTLSGDQHRMLMLIQRNVNILLRLVNQILDFRKIQNKKMKMRVQQIDLIPFIRHIMESFNSLADEHQIDFSMDTKVSSLKIWADSDKLEKILFNLLSNAFKYTPQGKQIKVVVQEEEKDVILAVEDQGIGIAENKQKSLFVRFENLVDKNLFNQASTGIGLSLVKELIDMHHGSISIRSKLGEGSCFSIRLQKGKEHFDETVEFILSDYVVSDTSPAYTGNQFSSLTGNEEENLNSEKETILIVEDNQELRFFIRTIFAQYFNVIEAENGNIGLEKSKLYMPDIIISDVMMPEKDGIEMVRELREEMTTSHIPIVMLTAKSTIESKIEGMKLGADDYITKPFSAAYLKARIFNLLEQRKKLQALYCASLLPASTEQPLAGKKETTTPALSPNDRKFMDKVMETIEKHLDNGDLTVEDIAGEVNMSRSVFFKKLKTLTGLSPVEFLKEIRMKRAAQLIETEEYNMAQIAYMVGLNDSHYFSKCFKQQYGMTPTEYKESRKQN